MSIDQVAKKYRLPDLCPALVDFIHCYMPSNSAPYLIGGQCSTVAHSCLQTKSFHNADEVIPSKLANACPPCEDWLLGLYDSVIINTDRSKTWLQSSLVGEWDFAGFDKWCMANVHAWTGHCVMQLWLILWVIPPQGSTQPLPDAFLAYAQCFDVVPQVNPKFSSRAGLFPEPAAPMFILKQLVCAGGVPLGDIIPLLQLHSVADLIPRFGTKADSQLTKQTSLAYSAEVWLNKYFALTLA